MGYIQKLLTFFDRFLVISVYDILLEFQFKIRYQFYYLPVLNGIFLKNNILSEKKLELDPFC